MKKKWIISGAVIVFIVVCIATFIGIRILTGNSADSPIANPLEPKIRLTFVDQSNSPIRNKDFTLESQNGIQCGTSPCPTNTKRYHGKTDSDGIAEVSQSYIQFSTLVNIDDFVKERAAGCVGGDPYEPCLSDDEELFYDHPYSLEYDEKATSYTVTISDPSAYKN